jgi:thiol-disulfide isomerase/thioredoxin
MVKSKQTKDTKKNKSRGVRRGWNSGTKKNGTKKNGTQKKRAANGSRRRGLYKNASKTTLGKGNTKHSTTRKQQKPFSIEDLQLLEEQLLKTVQMEQPIEPEVQEPTATNNKKAVVLIYANWCGHCQAMKPAWDQMISEIKQQPEMNDQYEIIEIESNDVDPVVSNINNQHITGENTKVAMEGYPTIGRIVNGSFEKYQGPRDKDSMMSELFR